MATLDDDIIAIEGAEVTQLVYFSEGQYKLLTNSSGTGQQVDVLAPVTSWVSTNPGTHEQSSLINLVAPSQQQRANDNLMSVLTTHANQRQISVLNHGLPAQIHDLSTVSHVTLGGENEPMPVTVQYAEAHQQVLVDTETPQPDQSTKTTLDKGVRDIRIFSNDKTKITLKTDEPGKHRCIVRKYDDNSKVWEGDLLQGQEQEIDVQKSMHYIFKRLTETNHERDERIRVEKLLNSRNHRKRKSDDDAESKTKIPTMLSNIEDLQKRVSVLEEKSLGFK